MNRFIGFVMRFAALPIAFLVPAAASASIPTTAGLEGALYSSGGGPSADGTYSVVFSLYKDGSTSTAGWTETAQVAVKGGLFTYTLGSTKAIDAATLASLGATPFLGIKVEADAELPRKPLSSVLFAVRAAAAEGVDCSGCIGTAQIDPNALAPYAKTSSLSKAATSGAYADLTGVPDLTVYAKLATLAKVATTGNYADLAGLPDLTAYAKIASLSKVAASGAYADLTGAPALANVATTGKYADLSGAPQAVDVGKDCGTGLVIKGIKADGTYNCVNPMDVSALPPDGLNEISNNLLFNQFVDSTAGTPNLAIKDNNPTGIADALTFPDIGIAQALQVNIDLTNTDLSTVAVVVFDPNNVAYNLCGNPPGTTGLAPCGKKGDALKTSFPAPTAAAKGDLTTWVGKNPKGKWSLQVTDVGFCTAGAPGCNPNITDGAVNSWSVQIQTLSSKKVQVKGDLIVDGALSFGSIGANNQNKITTGLVSEFASNNLKQCTWHQDDGTDNGPTYAACGYTKKNDNTVLRLTWSGTLRSAYNCNACCHMWTLRVDGNECTTPGRIDAVAYTWLGSGSGTDLHHNRTFTGICSATSGGPIKAGNHTVQLYIQPCDGYGGSDGYTGWNAFSRILVEEMF